MNVDGYVGVFNWIMLYRWDFEIYILYGMFILLKESFVEYFIGYELIEKDK